MGVPGLWDILNKAGKSRALTHLAVVDGFEGNRSGKRAYRIGIDASIWYHHASYGKGGENPEVRTLFFRLRSLAELPILPLFVFDGRERPKVKRGSRLGKSGSHSLTDDMRTMLNAFGMEWRTARGEAEAELAYLNRKGYIDGILTDDCDALIFGARTLIKNSSLSLSGNKSNPALDLRGKASPHHIMMYTVDEIQSHPDVGMSRGGLLLFALLCGGDYHKGVDKFGKVIAHALARCGFGDQLLKAYEEHPPPHMHAFLAQWRAAINLELRTNTRGFLPHRSSLVLPDDFPDMGVFEKYAYPVDSSRAGTSSGAMRDKGELDLGRLAQFCEEKFEWGYRSAIIKRFRTLMWHAAVIHLLRRAALMTDEKERTRRSESGIDDSVIRGPLKPSPAEAVGTPASLVKRHLAVDSCSRLSEDRYAEAFVNRGRQVQLPPAEDIPDSHPLIVRVVGARHHISTDKVLQYRIEISPVQLVSIVSAGIKGKRAEPSTTSSSSMEDDVSDSERPRNGAKKPPPHPESLMRIWVPGSMLHQVHPGLVEDYTREVGARKTTKTKRKANAKVDDDGDNTDTRSNSAELEQVRSRGKQPGNPGLAVTDLRPVNHAHSDPWFSLGGNGIAASLETPSSSSFLFTFPDPEYLGNDTISTRDDINKQTLVHGLVQEDDIDLSSIQSPIPSRFDILFDQVMGFPQKTSRSTKASNQKKRRRNPPPCDVLSKLDKLDARIDERLAKRQKIHVKEAAITSTEYRPFPMIPALSDPDAFPRKNFRSCAYPEPSSSQTSHSSSRSDNFIDLT